MCYLVPTCGAIITSLIWSKKRQPKIWWLNLMFYGGAIFGIIDHLYNGELFLFSGNLAKDLLLGVIITISILVIWVVLLGLSKISNVVPRCNES